MELTGTTFADVKAVLITTLGVEDRAGSLDAATPLFGSLPELDSMAVVELLCALEARFGITIDYDERCRRPRWRLGVRRSRARQQPLCQCRRSVTSPSVGQTTTCATPTPISWSQPGQRYGLVVAEPGTPRTTQSPSRQESTASTPRRAWSSSMDTASRRRL